MSAGTAREGAQAQPWWVNALIGVLALAGFAAFVVYMLGLLTATEVAWSRAVFLFSGVEAIAFAAAGFFFGAAVQRKRAEDAEEDAAEAREEAAETRVQGQALADAVREESGGVAPESTSGAPAAAGGSLALLIANRHFPPRRP